MSAGRARGRALAIDWGTRRCGVAISDPSRVIAQPLATLTRRAGRRSPVAAVVALIEQHGVEDVVVGLPLSPEGTEGPGVGEVRAFGEAVARRSGRAVVFWDERWSTALALKSARRAGVSDRDSRSRLDQMAAVAILQSYLDAQRAAGADRAGRG